MVYFCVLGKLGTLFCCTVNEPLGYDPNLSFSVWGAALWYPATPFHHTLTHALRFHFETLCFRCNNLVHRVKVGRSLWSTTPLPLSLVQYGTVCAAQHGVGRSTGASTTPLPLGLGLCAPSPPFLCYQAITALPSAPHRHAIMNTLSAAAPRRCILGVSQIFHPDRLSVLRKGV